MVLGTHPDDENASTLVKQFVRYGSSPRGAQSLVLGGKVNALMNGRLHVSMDDILQIVKPVLRHRIILNFEGEAEGIQPDVIIEELIEKINSKNASEAIV
jgi:MoxR-like ATPase